MSGRTALFAFAQKAAPVLSYDEIHLPGYQAFIPASLHLLPSSVMCCLCLQHIMDSGKTSISLYENSIPPFVESEMERLYRHIYSTLAHFKVYGDIAGNTNTYVVQENGTTITVLLFRLKKKQAQVLNEQINIDAKEIDRFASHIFATYPSVDVISFHAILTNMQRLAFPYQRFNITEDIVLTLPGTADEYLANLGKSTRKNIKHHMSRLKRDFPSLRFDVYLKEDMSEQHVRDIIDLNRARMALKKKVSSIDNEEAERIIKLAKQRGLVTVMTVDGRVYAGAICLRVGENYFSVASGHDPKYDNYRLGTLCFYQTICQCIERGGKEFHFMWGRYGYKYMLSGVQHNLDDLVIYRSRLQLLIHSRMAMQVALKGYMSMGKFWLLDKARQQDKVDATSWLAFHFLNYLRSLKRFTSGLLTWRK